MAFLSYLIAFGHFSSEILIFGSCHMGPVISPVIVSSKFVIDKMLHLSSEHVFVATSLIWMFVQYDFYVRN